jgi:hypothetical protein
MRIAKMALPVSSGSLDRRRGPSQRNLSDVGCRDLD